MTGQGHILYRAFNALIDKARKLQQERLRTLLIGRKRNCTAG